MAPDWTTVIEFENKIAEFFGAPFAVATDSCTHGLELCLRYKEVDVLYCPRHTYISVPMLANKLDIELEWYDADWKNKYRVYDGGIYDNEIYDAAVMWERGSYVNDTFMCLSFQHQKHLSLNRGGMILCPDKESYDQLKKMSYDGRLPCIPWRDQNIDTIGFHYYMTPETAALGLSKLQAAIDTPPRIWTTNDWPDISQFKVFQK